MKFISYKDWLLLKENVTPRVNIHMTHIEDLVLTGGKGGIKFAINILKRLYNTLKSNTEEDKISLSFKIDGAPAIFAWSKFPGLGENGIAIKALFAKNRKVMYNYQDVDNYYREQTDLARKLKMLLDYLPSINIPENEIWQGDFLYDKYTLKEDEKYYSFHPNTIVYKVPKDSDIGRRIANTDIGIVWHTRYKGDSISNIYASYDTRVSELSENAKVFMIDPYITSLAGIVTFTSKETEEFKDGIRIIEDIANKLYENDEYTKIIENEELISLFTIYQNLLIRENIQSKVPAEILDKFIDFMNRRFEKDIESKKTEKSKKALEENRDLLIQNIERHRETFESIIELILKLTELKKLFIKKLNNLSNFEAYLKMKDDKFVSTNQEGFVVSDRHGNVVKLVDRYEFSYANFSSDVVKGWSK